ncbi:unnamed protein product [Pelagomonas calceolata]|uniref:Uncharacterized protein n=1 Tax=Pelagomonas calceolata TaxID=35677 RepID=A0A8J2SZ67_9STRA|nr:unnamed protein product [Pelagomonas calceolata]
MADAILLCLACGATETLLPRLTLLRRRLNSRRVHPLIREGLAPRRRPRGRGRRHARHVDAPAPLQTQLGVDGRHLRVLALPVQGVVRGALRHPIRERIQRPQQQRFRVVVQRVGRVARRDGLSQLPARAVVLLERALRCLLGGDFCFEALHVAYPFAAARHGLR